MLDEPSQMALTANQVDLPGYDDLFSLCGGTRVSGENSSAGVLTGVKSLPRCALVHPGPFGPKN